jgi:hypothetical protein
LKPSNQYSEQPRLRQSGIFREEEDRNSLLTALWTQLIKRLDQTTTVDSDQRFASTIGSLQPVILDFPFSPSSEIIPALKTWTAAAQH